MKVNQFVLPLTLALAAMFATTGCKHGVPKTTIIPGHRTVGGGETGPGDTVPYNPNGGSSSSSANTFTPGENGHIPTTGEWNPSDFNADRSALSAYTVHFKYDSYVVQDKEQTSLSAVAAALASDANAKLLIEGHCDERGTDEYNRTLGEHRADALREALHKIGLDASRVRTISFGRDKPVDTGHSEASHAKNRRGEFVLLHPK